MNTRRRPIGVGLVGCGHVADDYVRQLRGHPGVALIGVWARRPERAREFAAIRGLRAYGSLDEMLADPTIDLVVNLTLPAAHADITERSLRAGKHVYSEKPLALDYGAARRLVALSRRRGLRLGCAPATFLGEAQQTAGKLVRQGGCGPIRVVNAEVNHGRIERYHPAPEPFFAVGPLWDVGVYPLTLLTAWFGPVRRVRANAHLLLPRRVAKGGRRFRISTPDWLVAVLELVSGPVVRLTANFYVDRDHSKGGGSIECHGDLGRIYVGDFQVFNAAVECGGAGETYRAVPLAGTPYPGAEFGRGVKEMVDAIHGQRPHRATGEHAAHVVEVAEAIQRSWARDGRVVRVRSRFAPPAPMPWAR